MNYEGNELVLHLKHKFWTYINETQRFQLTICHNSVKVSEKFLIKHIQYTLRYTVYYTVKFSESFLPVDSIRQGDTWRSEIIYCSECSYMVPM
jgi:hypothetical protein